MSAGRHADTPTIAVLGPGGVGGLLAAVLARAGEHVVVLAGRATRDALTGRGLHVDSTQFGSFTVPVQVADRLTAPVAAVLVATKHTTLMGALDRVPPQVVEQHPDTLVVPFLNGIEHVDALRARYGSPHVAAGVVRVESARVAPGVIRHGSTFVKAEVAATPTQRPAVEALVQRLTRAGVSAQVVDDEAAMLWSKLALLAPMALLTTVYDAPVGVIRDTYADELDAAIAEAAAIAHACGAPVEHAAVRAAFFSFPDSGSSSMHRDVQSGRPTELDAIAGAVLRAAAAHGISTPTLTGLARRVADTTSDPLRV